MPIVEWLIAAVAASWIGSVIAGLVNLLLYRNRKAVATAKDRGRGVRGPKPG
jgi:hypothetical protein